MAQRPGNMMVNIMGTPRRKGYSVLFIGRIRNEVSSSTQGRQDAPYSKLCEAEAGLPSFWGKELVMKQNVACHDSEGTC